jgi:lipopolysaccharide/colanic/teichoic acid biosynthesis glycosyltransferase
VTLGKRVFDLLAALAGIVILSPVLAAIAIAIRLQSGAPALFRQERIGRAGAPFNIWKFRTMVADAERRGGALTIGDDPRITRFGRLLRRAKLDELPQLANVLGGEMSLVGPRPEVARYVAMYTQSQRRVLDLVPGITDPASIQYRDEASVLARSADPERTYVEQIMPDKIRLNLEYAEHATMRSDVALILRTLVHLGR